ncbi:hypothetical protein FOS14_20640 [Skermania sp. ID1734]|uniref:Rv0361 family membrane protein n=1 Tax=Skermania sp. ID1734 TaxID=2597516 RepID=UPI00117DAA21|nr:hypothetical protein [Skermania sp. ID1734]TSD94430.1 hypothetical protein FOS14_20640 [Skermania sp. ID1734]
MTDPGKPEESREPLPPPMAMPQRVDPVEPPKVRKKRGKWLAAAAAAIVVICGAGAAIGYAIQQHNAANAPEKQIRAQIEVFAEALSSGNIQQLRQNSCGPLADYYNHISDADFAAVYKTAVAQKNIPVVSSINAVQVTDKTAIAQVTAYTKAEPQTKSARTFSLEETDQGWKVCDPPT